MTSAGPRALIVLPARPVRERIAELVRKVVPELSLLAVDRIEEAWDQLPTIEVLMTFGQFLTDEALARAERLCFVQALGSGLDGIVDRTGLGLDVMIANARGAHRDCVSEAAFAHMLALARNLPGLVRAQDAKAWAPGPSRLLTGKTVGILGVGVIAEGLAERCRAFGMTVQGISSRLSAPGFDALFPRSALETVVGGFDYFVLLAPLDDQSRHLIDAGVLRAMRPGSYLVNVARGGLVDEAALLVALRDGPLAAAALDVFEQEPLPATSELWSAQNLFITPHVAGQHDEYAESIMPFVGGNLRAYVEGRPEAIVNRVR